MISNDELKKDVEWIGTCQTEVIEKAELKGLNTAKPTYKLVKSIFSNKKELIDKISISSFNWNENGDSIYT